MPDLGDFLLNAKAYAISPEKPPKDLRKLFRRRTEQPFLEAETRSGQKDQESIRPHDSRVYHAPIRGLGIDRIPSDRSKDPEMYRRIYDATCDTRFGISVLPLLEQNNTETGLEVIRASVLFKSNLWAIWDDDTSTDVLARKFVGSTTSWDAGGVVAASGAVIIGQDLIANKTHMIVLVAEENDFKLYRSTDGATWTQATTNPAGNLLANFVTANEDIDAGLLVEVNGLAVAVLWDESNGNIIFYSSQDAGDNWESQTDIRAHFTKTLGPFVGGFGLDKIPALEDNNPLLAQRFYDATVDIWPSGAFLPLLEQNSTEETTGTASNAVIRASTEFKGELVAIAEDTDTIPDVFIYLYDGSATEWNFSNALKSDATDESIALDLINIGDRLIGLFAFKDDHHVSFLTTIGGGWTAATTDITTALLGASVGRNENRDAGLLAHFNNRVTAIVWDETNLQITFFESTNSGVDFTDKSTDIGSGNGPQGVATMIGEDGNNKLIVATKEGLWELTTGFAARHIWPMPAHTGNGRRMAIGPDGALWFAQGVSNDEVFQVFRLFVVDSKWRVEPVPNSPHLRDGVSTDMLGTVNYMKSSGGYMYISLGGGATGRNARIIKHNGVGWVPVRKHGTENQKIEWIDVSSHDDDNPRLHYAIRTSSILQDTKFLAEPNAHPLSGVTIPRAASGTLSLPYVDGGQPTEKADWYRVEVDATDLSATASNEYIAAAHGLDRAARSTTNLGNFLSGTKSLDYASGAQGVNDGVELTLHRDASVNTDTPILHALDMDFNKPPDVFGKIASGGGPKGVAVLGRAGREFLYVGTREGIYELDTLNAPWPIRKVVDLEPHDDNCVLPGSEVIAEGLQDASRVSYEGPALELITKGGRKLSVTPKHPILTDRGWMPADQLSIGDNLICTLNSEGMIAPDENVTNAPTKIENIFSSLDEITRAWTGRASHPAAISDFHGDGRFMDGNVDIVGADGLLRCACGSSLLEPVHEQRLCGTDILRHSLACEGALTEITESSLLASDSSLGRFGQKGTLFRRHVGEPVKHGFGAVSSGNVALLEPVAKHDRGQTINGTEGSNGLPAEVALDNLVEIRNFQFSGHVYDLQTVSELYTASGIVVHNCRRMTTHNNRIWFGLGVDDDTPAPIWTLDTSGNITTQVGLDVDDGVTSDLAGPVRWFESGGGFLYISVGGGKTGRDARVLCHNGFGWHSIRKHGTENEKIEWLALSSDDDATPRLHYAIRTGGAVSNTKHLEHPNTNPSSGVSIKRELNGFIDLPWIDGGMPSIDGIFLNAGIAANDLSAANSNEFINMDYAKDGEARAANDHGDFLSGTKALAWASGAGLATRELTPRLNLIRNSGTNTDTPKFRSLDIDYVKDPDTVESWRIIIDLVASAELQGELPETIITNLQTARDLGTLPTFEYGNSGTKFVKVFIPEWEEEVVEDSSEGSVAPANTKAIRKGTVEVLLEERI